MVALREGRAGQPGGTRHPLQHRDNYDGFRIVGTTDAMFRQLEYREGEGFEVQPGGRFFDPERGEAVLGSYAAERTGLAVGSMFHPSHGVAEHSVESHEEEYVVTAILEPPIRLRTE